MPVQDPNIRPTAVVMLNLGGPATLDEVEPFLMKLFADHEIMPLPFQTGLGAFIAKRRAPKVRQRYAEIGGRSPILHWTRVEGKGMVGCWMNYHHRQRPIRFTRPSANTMLARLPFVQVLGLRNVSA